MTRKYRRSPIVSSKEKHTKLYWSRRTKSGKNISIILVTKKILCRVTKNINLYSFVCFLNIKERKRFELINFSVTV